MSVYVNYVCIEYFGSKNFLQKKNEIKQQEAVERNS